MNQNNFLPKLISHVKVPPIKCQGIKTKLVPFIAENIVWSGKGQWVEPFLGSGVVAFNIAPEKALLADTNEPLIMLYKSLQSGEITQKMVRTFLEEHGKILEQNGESYYYEMRAQFNESYDPLKILFLNRSCFNGVMRFNSKGKFNVPFCRKPNRFSPSYITKIVNQIGWVSKLLIEKSWRIECWDWKKTLSFAKNDDFVYMDPPYIGRHTDYYNNWTDSEAINLAKTANNLECGFALSMWLKNKYRENEHIQDHWGNNVIRTISHFYHVGSTESLRNEMQEALVIKKGYENNQPIVTTPDISNINKSLSMYIHEN